ncbi:hypothetical protein HU200_034759 [Digitaria exilis]|uniref:C2H2-type domain-containing protein n=1 Tax=Digitaria exilis TaxID=1010633 RepID=A0A835EQ66_9POAL|nr:hypothetical protein HU200_034759 [Digitaria exilis]CAB3502772.1 unnamed protein product [Digitaria exilis]
MATTASRNSPAASANRLLLMLSLSSLSPASKAIAKNTSGKHHHRARIDGGGAFRFATFQALGGHRTSHKRPRVRADGLDLLLGARPGKATGAAAADVHRCHACGAVFTTGQALGGHMRRHRAAMAFDVVAALDTTTMQTTVSDDGLSEEGDDEDSDAGHVLTTTLIQFI